MLLSQRTLGRVALAWLAFLWGAGLVLPNLDSHAQTHPAVKAILAAGYATLLIATPISLSAYFNRAWRRVGTVSNTTVYVIWIGLESVAALGLLGVLAYPVIIYALARFR